jgi:sugar lactone lactonase YvrE
MSRIGAKSAWLPHVRPRLVGVGGALLIALVGCNDGRQQGAQGVLESATAAPSAGVSSVPAAPAASSSAPVTSSEPVAPAASSLPVTSSAPVASVAASSPSSSHQLWPTPRAPDELALAPDGTLFIADGIENAIYKRTPAGAFSVFAGTGVAGFTGDGGPATAAELNDPSGMLVEPDGALLFADGLNNRLRAIGQDGRISTVAGNGQFANVARPGAATAEPVGDPKDVAVDPRGGYYIATASQLLRLSGGQLSVVAGNNPLEGVVGIGGPALSGSVDGPGSIAVDKAGGIYVAGQNTKTLLYITPNGTLTELNDDLYVRGWGGLRAAPDGSVIGINTGLVERYRGSVATTIDAFTSTSDPRLQNVELNGLAVSTSGQIYVSSDGNSGFNGTPLLMRIDAAGRATILWAGTPT